MSISKDRSNDSLNLDLKLLKLWIACMLQQESISYKDKNSHAHVSTEYICLIRFHVSLFPVILIACAHATYGLQPAALCWHL